MQKRRLQELLRDNESIHTSQNAEQINSMIEMEKNFVIMQYENILQQLNVEF